MFAMPIIPPGGFVPWTRADVAANVPFFWDFTDVSSQNYNVTTKVWSYCENLGTEGGTSAYRMHDFEQMVYRDTADPYYIDPSTDGGELYNNQFVVYDEFTSDMCVCIVAWFNEDQGQGTLGGRLLRDRNNNNRYLLAVNKGSAATAIPLGAGSPTFTVDGAAVTNQGELETAITSGPNYIRCNGADLSSWTSICIGDSNETVRVHHEYYALAMMPQSVADANSDSLDAYFNSIVAAA